MTITSIILFYTVALFDEERSELIQEVVAVLLQLQPDDD